MRLHDRDVADDRCRAIENMLLRAEGSGRVAFREADHRACMMYLARVGPFVIERPRLGRASRRRRAASIQPVTWLGIGREELVSQAPYRGRGPPGPVRCGQGWTGPLGPRSRRNDYMMANVVVAGRISMSAAASTPVYFAMTGADAHGGGVEAGFT